MGQPGASAGLQTRRPGVPKNAPWPGRIGSSVRDGSFAPRGWQTKERGSPVCSTWGSAPSVRQAKAAEPRGAREADAVQVATQLRETGDLLLRLQGGRSRRNTASASVRVQAERLRSGRSDCRAVKLLSTQIVRKTGESNFHLERRFTLRVVPSSTLSNSTNGWLGWQRRSLSEDAQSLALRIHRCVKRREFIGDSRSVPVEIGCITAGKTVRMQQELCARRQTLFLRRRLRSPH